MTNLRGETELRLAEPKCHEVRVISDVAFDLSREEAANATSVQVCDSSSQSCDVLLLNFDCLSINYRDFAIEQLPDFIGDGGKRISTKFVKLLLVHARRIQPAQLLHELLVI